MWNSSEVLGDILPPQAPHHLSLDQTGDYPPAVARLRDWFGSRARTDWCCTNSGSGVRRLTTPFHTLVSSESSALFILVPWTSTVHLVKRLGHCSASGRSRDFTGCIWTDCGVSRSVKLTGFLSSTEVRKVRSAMCKYPVPMLLHNMVNLLKSKLPQHRDVFLSLSSLYQVIKLRNTPRSPTVFISSTTLNC